MFEHRGVRARPGETGRAARGNKPSLGKMTVGAVSPAQNCCITGRSRVVVVGPYSSNRSRSSHRIFLNETQNSKIPEFPPVGWLDIITKSIEYNIVLFGENSSVAREAYKYCV